MAGCPSLVKVPRTKHQEQVGSLSARIEYARVHASKRKLERFLRERCLVATTDVRKCNFKTSGKLSPRKG